MSRLALFDLETTGVDPHRDRIVTAAIIEAGAGVKTTTRSWMLNPVIDIPQGATDVHGITTEMARLDGRDASTGVRELAADLLSCIGSGLPVVGHNVVYDLTLLHAELVRHGHTTLAAAFAGIRPVIDTMVLEKQLDPYRPGKPNGRRPDAACGPHTLLECCRLWGVDLTAQEAHGAEADALAAGRLAWRLATDPYRFEQFDGPRGVDRINPGDWDLARLHDWQGAQYARSATSFQAYKRGEQRKKPDDVDPAFVACTEWPVQPLPADWSPDQLPTPATEQEAVA
ncbi:exonuclease domain-containing protein [Intrasporangium flavum]|uniref:exonuclease domain-containing protein n=1 Tax=Intrasporangium flavum TaxID=1428657 RepID=UPI001A979CCE|nr:exonuclease domain-containing protein [Intrasporangium flavum]